MDLGWFLENRDRFGGDFRQNETLASHTYYRIGGPADLLLVPRSLDDLKWISEGIQKTGCEYFVLGAGSNLLVSDDGFRGVILKTGKLNLEIEESNGILRTGASIAVATLLRKAAAQGWKGIEFMAGVPGTMGGVVTMNAGTYLGEAKDRVHAVEYFQPRSFGSNPVRIASSEMKFEYRKNLFLPDDAFIWAVEWKIEKATPEEVKALIDEPLEKRKKAQPVEFPSCGSVFKNPLSQGFRAWEVMDRLGLRGRRIGNAQFSEKHPNFIINLGNARAVDVRALIDLAKSEALSRLNVTLEEEVRYLGEASKP